ncbi:hypothetical protein AB9H28_23770, partial [Salmonella enterica subsp. enterica serovar Kentucky]|uniref:hypothetical protein n=1 Tax=Salmonella enterica TaxID=28901 RepID=UPI003F4C4A81
YDEVVDSTALLEKIAGIVRRKYGKGHPFVDVVCKNFKIDVAKCHEIKGEVSRTIHSTDSKKMFTYTIKPFKIQFEQNGATYNIDKEGNITHDAGERPYTTSSGRRFSGLSEEESDKLGIPLGKTDAAYTMERIERKANEIAMDKLIVAGKASPLPPSEGGKPKSSGKDKPKAEQTSSPCGTKPLKSDTVTTITGRKWSKKITDECNKFGVNPDEPPKDKPNGMRKNIWKQVNKAA